MCPRVTKSRINNDLSNLYIAARRARANGNVDLAREYYTTILAMDPNSWEANFYAVYFQAAGCVLGGIPYASDCISQYIPTTIELVKATVPAKSHIDAINDLYESIVSISVMFAGALMNHHMEFSDINDPGDVKGPLRSVARILYTFGDCIDSVWGRNMSRFSTDVWARAIDIEYTYLPNRYDKKRMRIYGERIKKYDPSYKLPGMVGCYVATAVYGSYDCPEVWTLRRYRDHTLSETWYGRVFIKSYYAISPTLVKYFGNKMWFRKVCKAKLDKLVNKLQNNGVASTPYNDKVW